MKNDKAYRTGKKRAKEHLYEQDHDPAVARAEMERGEDRAEQASHEFFRWYWSGYADAMEHQLEKLKATGEVVTDG